MILGLRTCIYRVGNLSDATKWYTEAFKTEPYFNEDFYVGFNIQGYELGLQPEEVKSKKGNNVITYWGVADIESEYNRFLELGAKAEEAPTNVGGEILVSSVIDPWQNIIGLIYNPYFKLPD